MNLISLRSFRRLLHLLLINEPTVVNDEKLLTKAFSKLKDPRKRCALIGQIQEPIEPILIDGCCQIS